MNKQYQRVLVTTPHPLLRLVCLGLVTFIFTLFSLELTRFGTLLAPLWFPTSIMMVAFYRHAGKCGPALPSPALLAISLPRGCSSHGNRSTSPTRRSISLRPRLARCYCVNCSWYNPLQNLNDWVRLALGSALVPPLVGAFWFIFWCRARSRCVISLSGYFQRPLARWRWCL